VCEGCGAIQPPAPVDHFARLGLEARFLQDPHDILARYRARVRRVHPDRAHDRTGAEREWALGQAAALNEALYLLHDPLRRAEYLLELRGAPAPAVAEADLAVDHVFRMELIEVEQASMELHGDDGHEERDRLAREVATRYERELAVLGAHLDASPDDERLPALARAAARLRRLAEVLRRWARGAA
jgi:molecular chaperone HscB